MPDTAGNRSPLRIPFTFQKRGNTDLLTSVRERIAPAPTSYLLTGLPRNGWLSPRRKIASAWSHAHSTVSCRPSGLLPGLPCSRSVAGSACITVCRYSFFQRVIVRMKFYGREGRALHEASSLPPPSCMPFLSISGFFSRSACFAEYAAFERYAILCTSACMAVFHALGFHSAKQATGPAACNGWPLRFICLWCRAYLAVPVR